MPSSQKMNTTIKNMSAEGDARFTTIKAKLARLKNTDNKTKTKNLSVDKIHQLQEDQTKARAVAPGFHEDTTKQKAKDLLANTMTEAGMSSGKSSHQMPREADQTNFPAVH